MGFIYLGAQTSCTPQHLFVQNTGFDAAHKNNLSNFRHINSGRKQINGYGNGRIVLILKPLNRILYPSFVTDCIRDFLYCRCSDALRCIYIAQLFDNLIRMAVAYGKDECLFFTFGIYTLSKLGKNRLIEGRGNNLFVEVFYIKIQFIFKLFRI